LHEWQASVMHKAHGKTGCPKCAKANSGRKADGTRQKHPTFAAAQHVLLQQWDHDRNREIENFPDIVRLTTRHYAAASSSGGSAMNAPRSRCTAGRLAQLIEPHRKSQQDALVVLGRSFVTATL